MTNNLSMADTDDTVTWACCKRGVEETVHLNIYSPPSGDVKLIDIIGDYGGFVFTDLDKPAENTFANHNNDRWITAMNADYPDINPELLVVTPRGNWKDKTKGGLILSRDQGASWEQLSDPVGLTKDIDQLIKDIKRPNVTSGWTEISADGAAILWVLGFPIYASRLVYTHDFGKTWGKSKVYDLGGNSVSGENLHFKVVSDRIKADIFYGFSDIKNGEGFYVSVDKGRTFKSLKAPEGFPGVNLAEIDSEQQYEIRVESGKEGVIWMAMQQYGLWRLTYSVNSNSFSGERVSAEGDYIKRIGLQGKYKFCCMIRPSSRRYNPRL